MNTEQDERLAEIRNVSGDRSLFDHHDMRFVLSQLDARDAQIAALTAEREGHLEGEHYLRRLFLDCAPQCTPMPEWRFFVTQIDNLIAGLRAALAQAEAAMRGIIDSGALSEVEATVAGWRGPPDAPYERHPSRLGATISTNCGRMYKLADALAMARSILAAPAAAETGETR